MDTGPGKRICIAVVDWPTTPSGTQAVADFAPVKSTFPCHAAQYTRAKVGTAVTRDMKKNIVPITW